MSISFTHLHLHSHHSLMDGMIRYRDLLPHVRELGMDAVALTDHGNMFGALNFYQRARRVGIKPILGCEVYVAPDMRDRGSKACHHLVLLARTLEGYRNLVHLVSMGYLEGFHRKPRVDRKLLAQRSAGLIGLSGCLGGEVPQAYLEGGLDRGVEMARAYAASFESGRFFLEVQSNGLAVQEEVNEGLVEIASRTGLGLVATNDCHYLNRSDAKTHEVLLCVRTGGTMADADRFRFDTDELHLKSPGEMEQTFGHLPEALENTAAIAASCDVELAPVEKALPAARVPRGRDTAGHLARLAQDGLEARLTELGTPEQQRPAYRERLAAELEVLVESGLCAHILIACDVVAHAREIGVPVGPGRSGAAGSLVCFALGITQVDPLAYDLLFERFINPERVSAPFICLDLCKARRHEVMDHVRDVYGQNRVAGVASLQQFSSREAVREVARALGRGREGDRLAALIPDRHPGRPMSIGAALKEEPRLRDHAGDHVGSSDLLDLAVSVEGINKKVERHPAWVALSPTPMWEHCPVFVDDRGHLATQGDWWDVNHDGLQTLDIFGHGAITTLARAEARVRDRQPGFRLDRVPMDDAAALELFAAGQADDVIRLVERHELWPPVFESPGLGEVMQQIRPTRFEHVVAAVSLHRPGPIEGGLLEAYVERNDGAAEVSYLHPWMKPVLAETYGLLLYQEQVIQLAMVMAGHTAAQGDLLRRALGKKRPVELKRYREAFLLGARRNGLLPNIAGEIHDFLATWTVYTYMKAHSVCYARLLVQGAYLKCHHGEALAVALKEEVT